MVVVQVRLFVTLLLLSAGLSSGRVGHEHFELRVDIEWLVLEALEHLGLVAAMVAAAGSRRNLAKLFEIRLSTILATTTAAQRVHEAMLVLDHH